MPTSTPNMLVHVHRNHIWAGGQGFSILNHNYKLVDRAMFVVLKQCRFVIHPHTTDKRSVHAFVRGVLIGKGNNKPKHWPTNLVAVDYNPFDQQGFTVDDQTIHTAPYVWFADGTAWVR